MTAASLHAWTSEIKSLARVVFGLLLFRLGMEQVVGFPEPSGLAPTSLEGLFRVLAFPGGMLLMLGLLTRPVAFVLSVVSLVVWIAGPLAAYILDGIALFGQRSASDPLLLNAFLLFYLGVAGAGCWSVDRLRGADVAAVESPWSPYALAALRIATGFLFLQHGIPKLFGPELPPLMSTRFLAGVLECAGGPLLMAGLGTRPVAFVLSGEMAFAYFMTHAPNGFWGSFATPSMQAAILDCFVFAFLCQAGSGSWSVGALRLNRRAREAGSAEPRASAGS